ncbi:MAG: ATP-dependent Clp protease proteolytic subunit [Fibrobacterales bacterium]
MNLKQIILLATLLISTLYSNNKEQALTLSSVEKPNKSKQPFSSSSKIESPTAAVITLEEMVDPGMADYVERAISQAVSQSPQYIIFEVNTFGGRLDAAFNIVDAITAIPDSITTIAFVNKKAISAGALISFASNMLYMKPTTTIGDCAPVIQGQQGPVMMGEKIQSPLRAKFRNLAERNGYPKLLSQAMVSSDLEVLKLTYKDSIQFVLKHEWEEMDEKEQKLWKKKTIVRKDELLTLTNTEAETFGFSRGTIKDIDALVKHLGITTHKSIDINWAEQLARFIGTISPILMLIGFGAIYMEIKTPGFGIFGIIGIIALSIVFLGQYVAGIADHIGLIFVTLGIILVLVEIILVPGTLISASLGVICFIIAFGLSLKGGDISTPDITLDRIDLFLDNVSDILLLAIASLIVPIIISKYLLPRMPRNLGIMIDETLVDSHTKTIQESNYSVSIGDSGITKSDLRPTGKALFDGKQIEVLGQSGYIEKGSTVIIISIEGQKVIVKKG